MDKKDGNEDDKISKKNYDQYVPNAMERLTEQFSAQLIALLMPSGHHEL